MQRPAVAEFPDIRPPTLCTLSITKCATFWRKKRHTLDHLWGVPGRSLSGGQVTLRTERPPCEYDDSRATTEEKYRIGMLQDIWGARRARTRLELTFMA